MNVRQRKIARTVKRWVKILEYKEPYSRLKRIAQRELAVNYISKSKRRNKKI